VPSEYRSASARRPGRIHRVPNHDGVLLYLTLCPPPYRSKIGRHKVPCRRQVEPGRTTIDVRS